MRTITISFEITEENKLKSTTFEFNNTSMKSDSETLMKLFYTGLKALTINSEDVKIQDMLNDVGIKYFSTTAE